MPTYAGYLGSPVQRKLVSPQNLARLELERPPAILLPWDNGDPVLPEVPLGVPDYR